MFLWKHFWNAGSSATRQHKMLLEKDAKPQISKEEIELPQDSRGQLAFLLHNVLTQEECQALIKETEKIGYTEALLNIGNGKEISMKDVRNSSRCIIDSVDDTEEIWRRIQEFIPVQFKKRTVIGLNERMRFLRYDPGDYFKPHMDGVYVRDNGERSCITFQAYLNEGFEGGATTFLGMDNEEVAVVPKTGTVLIFEHAILHEGSELIKGRKYSVRTDIMYSAHKVQVSQDMDKSHNTGESCHIL